LAIKRYFVSSSPGGGWAIFREGEPRPLQQLPRKITALETARTMARFTAPSEVIVEQEDGTYQRQYDFGPGADV
jgi:hypothetical protein